MYRGFRFAKYLGGCGWNVAVLTTAIDADYGDAGLKIPDQISIDRTRIISFLDPTVRFRNVLIGRKTDQEKRAPIRTGIDHRKRKTIREIWRHAKDTMSLILTFPDDKIGWFPYGLVRGWKIIKRKNIDVIYTSGPPHSVHLIGLALQRLTSKPWIADFRDPWARKPWLKEEEKRNWRQHGIEKLERWVVERATHLILNTESMVSDFVRVYERQGREKFSWIPNGYDQEDFLGLYSRRNGGPFRITHTGTLYKKRNPLILLEAVRTLIDSGLFSEKDIEIEFIGKIILDHVSIEEKSRELGLRDAVRLIPQLPHRECMMRLYDSDVLLVVQPETDTQIPGKIFEYLFVGKPILALAHEGATRDFVQKNKLGYVANPDQLREVSDALRSLYENHRDGRNPDGSRDSLLQFYEARNLTRMFGELMTRCLSSPLD